MPPRRWQDSFAGMHLHAGFLFLVILLAFGSAGHARDTNYLDSATTQRLLAAQAAILEDQFTVADSIARTLIVDRPDDPAGYSTRAATMLAQMSFAEEDLYHEKFDNLLDTIQQLCETQLKSTAPTRRAWLYLFLGHVQAYRSLHESKFGSSFTAVKAGLRTRKYYSAGLAEDTGLIDLYFGLGSYHYWKSVKAGLFRWLGIFHNDIDLGIDELRRAADSSVLSRDVSLGSLAWIWLDREQYDSTCVTAERMKVRYPSGTSFLWPEAAARFAQKDYERARAVYAELREKMSVDPGNYFNVIECDYYLATCREKSGSLQAARAEASRLNNYERYVTPAIRKRQEGKLRYLHHLLEEPESAVSTN